MVVVQEGMSDIGEISPGRGSAEVLTGMRCGAIQGLLRGCSWVRRQPGWL